MLDVLVIGGANIDIKAKTLGPHIPATSNPGRISQSFGGVGRNIASNLAKLGAATAFLSAVGTDAQGGALLRALNAGGIDTSLCRKVAGATGIYCAVLNELGELVTAVSDMSALESLTPDVLRCHAKRIQEARYIIADCNLSLDSLAALAELAGEKLVVEPVSVAKSQRLWELLRTRKVFAATPNVAQLNAFQSGASVPDAIRHLHGKGLRSVVVHAGAAGAWVSDGIALNQVPSQADMIVDVTGAGDAAVAGLVFGLLQNLPLAEAAALGQKTAARVMASAASALE